MAANKRGCLALARSRWFHERGKKENWIWLGNVHYTQARCSSGLSFVQLWNTGELKSLKDELCYMPLVLFPESKSANVKYGEQILYSSLVGTEQLKPVNLSDALTLGSIMTDEHLQYRTKMKRKTLCNGKVFLGDEGCAGRLRRDPRPHSAKPPPHWLAEAPVSRRGARGKKWCDRLPGQTPALFAWLTENRNEIP